MPVVGREGRNGKPTLRHYAWDLGGQGLGLTVQAEGMDNRIKASMLGLGFRIRRNEQETQSYCFLDKSQEATNRMHFSIPYSESVRCRAW